MQAFSTPRQALQQAWPHGHILFLGLRLDKLRRPLKFVQPSWISASADSCSKPSRLYGCLRRSFAGEGLERERFAEHAMESYRAGVGFAGAKANLESLNR